MLKTNPQKRNKHLVVWLSVGGLVGMLLAAGIVWAWLVYNAQTETATYHKSYKFQVSDSKLSGWWAGGYFDATADSLAGRVISQGTPDAPGTCFVMYNLKTGTVTPQDAVSAVVESREADGIEVNALDAPKYSMSVEGVQTPFMLYQYQLTGEKASTSSKGLQYAYINTGNNHIEIQGVCEEASQLPATLSTYGAVSLSYL